jgi:trimethylamine--corrinoid protein Co-methyltransferase
MVYGAFTSNVGHAHRVAGVRNAGVGQGPVRERAAGATLRLPWRSSNATASNVVDGQAAYESEMAVWGAVMAGGEPAVPGRGLARGRVHRLYEKLILDAEILQMLAEVLQPLEVDDATLGFDAIADVGPAATSSARAIPSSGMKRPSTGR